MINSLYIPMYNDDPTELMFMVWQLIDHLILNNLTYIYFILSLIYARV